MSNSLVTKTLLVTGGLGFMGSNFIRHMLCQKKFVGKVINFDSMSYAAHQGNVKEWEKDPRYLFVKGDVQDGRMLRTLHAQHSIDVIIHFAAETHVDRSIEEPQAFIDTNVFGTTQLLECVRKDPTIHFHLISTDEVYGSLGESGTFSEDSPYRPNSPYSASKAAADHFASAYSKTYGLNITLSHACNNYGPHQFPEKFIPLMILNCFGKKPLPIYGNGKNQRDWLYVDDHSKAIETIITAGKREEVYNIGTGIEYTNLDLLTLIIREVAKQTGTPEDVYKHLIQCVPDRKGHDFRYSLDTEKIQGLGWSPTVELQAGVEATIKWYLSHPEWVSQARSGDYGSWLKRQYPQIFAGGVF